MSLDFSEAWAAGLLSGEAELRGYAKAVKEMHSYVCPDIFKEFKKYDQKPEKYFRTYENRHAKTKQPWTCDIGFERFQLLPQAPLVASLGARSEQ